MTRRPLYDRIGGRDLLLAGTLGNNCGVGLLAAFLTDASCWAIKADGHRIENGGFYVTRPLTDPRAFVHRHIGR